MIVVGFGCVMCTLCQGHVNKKGVPSLCITPWTSPRSDFRWRNHGHLIAGLAEKILPVFHRCLPPQPPLASVVVVVVHIVADFLLHPFVQSAFLQMHLILCMSEEGFLRCIVPAVSASRHRLDDIMLRQVFPVFAACVVASLVAVDHEVFRKPIDLVKLCKHRQDETEVDPFGYGPGDDLVRADILDRGKIASPVAFVVDVAVVG